MRPASSGQIKISDPANRRSSQRMHARRQVRIECRKGTMGLGANIATKLLDISEGGMRFITKAAVTADDEVEIILLGYGPGDALKRIATVCWAVEIDPKQFIIGVRFQKRLSYREVQSLGTP